MKFHPNLIIYLDICSPVAVAGPLLLLHTYLSIEFLELYLFAFLSKLFVCAVRSGCSFTHLI